MASGIEIATVALGRIMRSCQRSGDNRTSIAEIAADALVDLQALKGKHSITLADLIERLVGVTSRELARQAYIRQFGQAQADRWCDDREAWIDGCVALFHRPARDLLAVLIPLVVDPSETLAAVLSFEKPARALAEAEALVHALVPCETPRSGLAAA